MTKEQRKDWCEALEQYGWNTLTSATSGSLFQYIVKGEKYGIDAYATGGSKGREFAIEIKTRTCNHNTFKNVFIEPDKIANAFLNHQFDKREQLYICIYKDKYLLVWNLNKLKHKPKYDPTRRIKNYDEQGYAVEGRFLLEVADAAKYKISEDGKNIKLINE